MKKLMQWCEYNAYLKDIEDKLAEEEKEDEGWNDFDDDVGTMKMPMIINGGPGNIPAEVISPFSYHNFHKCNTNFKITHDVVRKIAETEGVEIVYPTSKYSFVVAVGRLFSEVDVKESICKEICNGNQEAQPGLS